MFDSEHLNEKFKIANRKGETGVKPDVRGRRGRCQKGPGREPIRFQRTWKRAGVQLADGCCGSAARSWVGAGHIRTDVCLSPENGR